MRGAVTSYLATTLGAYSAEFVQPFRLKPSSSSGGNRPAVPGQTVQAPGLGTVPPERSDARSSSLLLLRVGSTLRFHLPHGLSFEGEPVGAMDQPVEDGVGHRGIGDGAVPVLDGQLA